MACPGQFFSHKPIGCLLPIFSRKHWGWQVTQFGVQPLAVVEDVDVVRNVVHGLSLIGVIFCQSRSIFKFRKKRSITALSQQLLFRLMLATKTCFLKSAW